MEIMKTLQLFRNVFLSGFDVKQITDFLSFLFLLNYIRFNFNEKLSWILELIMKI